MLAPADVSLAPLLTSQQRYWVLDSTFAVSFTFSWVVYNLLNLLAHLRPFHTLCPFFSLSQLNARPLTAQQINAI